MQAYDKVIKRIIAPGAETFADVVVALGSRPRGRYLVVTPEGHFLVRALTGALERAGVLDVVSACGRLAPDRSVLVLADPRGVWAGAVVTGRGGGTVSRGPTPAVTDAAQTFRVLLEVRPAEVKS